jgi:hypothetical protein
MHVPEHALTLLVEGASCDDPRHVRSTDSGASPPPLRFLRIRMGTHYVRERDLQATPESPQLVHASYMDNQGVFGKLHFGHGGVTPFVHTFTSSHLSSQSTKPSACFR